MTTKPQPIMEPVASIPGGLSLYRIVKVGERHTSEYFVGFDISHGITVTPKAFALLYSAMNVDAQGRIETDIINLRKAAAKEKP